MNSFDPDALECLAAIVEEGGFARAAQRLAITQSAVSQRLRVLETQAATVLSAAARSCLWAPWNTSPWPRPNWRGSGWVPWG